MINEMTKTEEKLLATIANDLLCRMDEKDNVTLKSKVFTDITRSGKQVQLQLCVTDTDLLKDFIVEETKHYGSFKDFKEKSK